VTAKRQSEKRAAVRLALRGAPSYFVRKRCRLVPSFFRPSPERIGFERREPTRRYPDHLSGLSIIPSDGRSMASQPASGYYNRMVRRKGALSWGGQGHQLRLRSVPDDGHLFRAFIAEPESLIERWMGIASHDFYFGGGGQQKNLSFVQISEHFGALWIGALCQHGADPSTLPQICLKIYITPAGKVMR